MPAGPATVGQSLRVEVAPELPVGRENPVLPHDGARLSDRRLLLDIGQLITLFFDLTQEDEHIKRVTAWRWPCEPEGSASATYSGPEDVTELQSWDGTPKLP